MNITINLVHLAVGLVTGLGIGFCTAMIFTQRKISQKQEEIDKLKEQLREKKVEGLFG